MSLTYGCTYFYYKGYSYQTVNSIDYIESFITGVVGVTYLYPYTSSYDNILTAFSRLYIDCPSLNIGYLPVSSYDDTYHLTTINSYTVRNTYVLDHYSPIGQPMAYNLNMARATNPTDTCWAGEIPSKLLPPLQYLEDCYRTSLVKDYAFRRASFLQPWRSDDTTVNGHNLTFTNSEPYDNFIYFEPTTGYHDQLSYSFTGQDAGNDSGSFPYFGYNPAYRVTYADGNYANMLPFVSDHTTTGTSIDKYYWRLDDDYSKPPRWRTHVKYYGFINDTFIV